MPGHLDARVEAALVRAEKLALSLLSPRARATIIALKALSGGRKKVEEVREQCVLYGFTCRQLDAALKSLEAWGLVSCGDEGCSLTEEGANLAEALTEFSSELREYLYSVVRGTASDLDTFSYMATPLASIVGLVEAVAEEPESLGVALVLHTYVSALAAAAIGILARMEPGLVDSVRRLYGGGAPRPS